MLLIGVEHQRQVVACACPVARRARVRTGMTLAHARALLPPEGVLVEPFTPQRDEAMLRRLARWALRFTPIASADPPDGLLLDITGCAHLHGGEAPMAQAVLLAIRELGFNARAAVASTPGCAWAVARYGDSDLSVVPPGAERAALAPLPCSALRIGEETQIALAEIGIDRIGQLLDLPRASLPARFGPELLLRLDQALGQAMELLDPVRPCVPLAVERVFNGPATQPEAVWGAARELVDELCRGLQERESGATRLTLRLARADAGPVDLHASLSRPSRDPRHLWSLLWPQLERANLGYGVDALILTAAAAARLPHEQVERWRPAEREHAAAWGRFIDTLIARLGPDRVGRPEPRGSHIPERAQTLASILETPKDAGAAVAAADRPSLLLDRPEEIQAVALFPDGAPSWIRSRAGESRILAGIGPERIGPEWWRAREPARDYFKIQDEQGRWLWVYRELQSGRWFLHGVWA